MKHLYHSLPAAMLMASGAHAFPGFMVDSCDRPLEIGHVIMGFPVAASEDAPANQQHSITATLAGSADSICGGTVDQGAELTISVDETLASLVAAEGWTMGSGPNYLVEASNGSLELRGDPAEERGCENTRIVNPGASINVVALSEGEMVIRLLTSYSFGQVWASEECVVSVTGGNTLAQAAGFIVDNTSLQAQADLVTTAPFDLTVEQLLAGSASGYSILQFNEDESTFSVKYAVDSSDVPEVVALLESLPAETSNVQVSFTGFESDDGTSVDLIELAQCESASTCDGFFSLPTDQVCLADGVCIESSTLNEIDNTITTTIVTDDDAWLGIGFTTPGGGMNAGGAGSDIFVCSAEGLRRFTVTTKSNPATSSPSETIVQDDPSAQVVQNLCVLDEETGTRRMTFTRSLEGLHEIVPGTSQFIIYARGPSGEQALNNRHPNNRRGEVSLDLTVLEGGVSGGVQQSAPWILWVHIICMSLSWGLLLPLAVVIANRCRNVPGGSTTAWYSWHKSLARFGWLLQTVGAICAVYYAEVYSTHLESRHAKFGVFIVIAGFLQPLSAVIRPHSPAGGWPEGKKPVGRTMFELYHKGIGWTAIVSGLINVFLGARLAKDLTFEDVVSIVPISIGSAGASLSFLFMLFCLVSPANGIAKALVGEAKPGTPEGPQNEVEYGISQ